MKTVLSLQSQHDSGGSGVYTDRTFFGVLSRIDSRCMFIQAVYQLLPFFSGFRVPSGPHLASFGEAGQQNTGHLLFQGPNEGPRVDFAAKLCECGTKFEWIRMDSRPILDGFGKSWGRLRVVFWDFGQCAKLTCLLSV